MSESYSQYGSGPVQVYRATYGGKACRFSIREGAPYGWVDLDRDPGYGSMHLASVPPCSVEIGELVPPLTDEQRAEIRRGYELNRLRFLALTGSPAVAERARLELAELEV